MIDVTITLHEPRGASQIYVEYTIRGPGWIAEQNLSANVDNTGPAQAVTQLRNKVIAFCASDFALVVAAKDVWIWGGPQ